MFTIGQALSEFNRTGKQGQLYNFNWHKVGHVTLPETNSSPMKIPIFPSKWWIFHGYVSLPEGRCYLLDSKLLAPSENFSLLTRWISSSEIVFGSGCRASCLIIVMSLWLSHSIKMWLLKWVLHFSTSKPRLHLTQPAASTVTRLHTINMATICRKGNDGKGEPSSKRKTQSRCLEDVSSISLVPLKG